MKSWFKKFVVVSIVLAISMAVVSSGYARPGDADTQVQVEIDQYTAKIKANPRDFDSISQRGLLYWKIGNLQKSELDANSLISLRPQNAFGYWLRAICAKKQKDHYLGLKFIREAIKRESFNIDHVHYEMSCLRDLKKFSELYDATVNLEKMVPRDAECFYFRGFARNGLDHDKGAVKAEFQKARSLAVDEHNDALISDVDQVLSRLR